MTDFQQRLEVELRRAIDAHEAPRRARRSIRVPLPRAGALAGAVAVAVALVIGIAIGQRTADEERAAVPPTATLPTGTYDLDAGTVEGAPDAENTELWVRGDSVRLIGTGGTEPYTQTLGLTTVRGNRVEFRTPPSRSSDWDDARCRAPGVYAFDLVTREVGYPSIKAEQLEFTLVSDACPLRIAALDKQVWRR